MSNIRVAREFFLQHLPVFIQEKIDFDSLAFQKESFIDEEFKTSVADVVYAANFKGEKGYLYTLVEHQSTVDCWMSFRLMRYMLHIMEFHHRQYPDESLPVIYPIVFYNGTAKYTGSMDFFDLFGKHKQLVKNIFNQPFQLVDVRKIDDDELRQYQWVGILEFVFKHRRARNFLVFAEQVMIWLHQLESREGFDYAGIVIKYIINGLEGENVEILVAAAQQHLSKELGEETMTFADQLREQGYQRGVQDSKLLIEKGYQEGILVGVKEGIQHGIARVVNRLLENGMPVEKIAEVTGLTISEIECLQFSNQLSTATE